MTSHPHLPAGRSAPRARDETPNLALISAGGGSGNHDAFTVQGHIYGEGAGESVTAVTYAAPYSQILNGTARLGGDRDARSLWRADCYSTYLRPCISLEVLASNRAQAIERLGGCRARCGKCGGEQHHEHHGSNRRDINERIRRTHLEQERSNKS